MRIAVWIARAATTATIVPGVMHFGAQWLLAMGVGIVAGATWATDRWWTR